MAAVVVLVVVVSHNKGQTQNIIEFSRIEIAGGVGENFGRTAER